MIVRQFLKWKESADVTRRAAAAAALARAYLTAALDIDERVAAEAALTLLLDDPSPKVRLALAEALSTSPRAPAQIVTALAHDQTEIAAMILARSPVIAESDLVERARGASGRLQGLIAARPEVPPRLALALARHGSADSAVALLSNANARICARCRAIIVERHAGHAGVRGALLQRGDLEPELRYALMRAAGTALGESALYRHAVGEAAPELIRDTRQKALCALLRTLDGAPCEKLIDALGDTGDLTPVMMVRAACEGQIDFLAELLSVLTEVPTGRVTAIMVNHRPNQLRALLGRAGLVEPVQTVLVHAVALWREIAIGRLVAGVQEVTRRLIETMDEERRGSPHAANDDIVDLLRAIHLDAMRDNARAHARELAAA
ncbi:MULTISPECIES: DUF2336 domain-containing protein [unclassified Roseitalea]|uniref:DUF2336 domain-containing protein n=1 Tax=unclassified Roseitalea TaxID=2639107 RepID=UPI00273E6F85|nr:MULTISPECIES: DUF2336 domain-containing protein [unclassified Roseitalea]